ncbi:MAG: TRAP transporter small permease [Oscillibacter sp.]|nr:TRAP transporter small permease [Oscillibacter sp.]
MLKKIGDILEKLILAVLALLMGAMILVTVAAVVQRYVIGSAFNWAEEFCGYDMVWCAFLGAAVAFHHKDLVLLDLFTNMMPQKARKTIQVLIQVICLALIAYLAVTGFRYSLSPSIFMRKCTTLPFTMFVPFVSLPIGMLFMFLFGLENLLGMLADIGKSETEEGA